MKKLFSAGNRYLKSMNIADMAVLKICLISMGILIGLFIPSKSKKSMGLLMGMLFGGTYVPLMVRLFSGMKDTQED